MDLKVLLATFWTVFLAELGDKTQLAVFTLGAAGKSRVSVFIGASAALVLSTLIAVALAEVVASRVNPRWTQGLAGALLVVMGAISLYGALRPGAG
ncbi:TMEM165/GDT1 family protein [Sorangium sp. So ce131]|uniref:TMEM165/GDT1 family protein n=1 Tax=Sorangium sp. So ce131 TaxID=3133282 RepID=UPI003F61F6AC